MIERSNDIRRSITSRLAEREHVDAGRAQVAHRRAHLLVRLATRRPNRRATDDDVAVFCRSDSLASRRPPRAADHPVPIQFPSGRVRHARARRRCAAAPLRRCAAAASRRHSDAAASRRHSDAAVSRGHLAEAEHDRRLGVERRVGHFRALEHGERLRVARALVAHERLEPLDGLDVVRVDVEPGGLRARRRGRGAAARAARASHDRRSLARASRRARPPPRGSARASVTCNHRCSRGNIVVARPERASESTEVKSPAKSETRHSTSSSGLRSLRNYVPREDANECDDDDNEGENKKRRRSVVVVVRAITRGGSGGAMRRPRATPRDARPAHSRCPPRRCAG